MLATCGLPLSFEAIKNKTIDVSLPFTYMWFYGEIFVWLYVWPQRDWPLITNYTINILTIIPVIIYNKRDLGIVKRLKGLF